MLLDGDQVRTSGVERGPDGDGPVRGVRREPGIDNARLLRVDDRPPGRCRGVDAKNDHRDKVSRVTNKRQICRVLLTDDESAGLQLGIGGAARWTRRALPSTLRLTGGRAFQAQPPYPPRP